MPTISEQKKFVQIYKDNPKRFFLERLKVKELWQGEDIILETVKEHKKVAVASGHALGKDFIGGGLPLWFLLTNYPSKVIINAPCSDAETEILTEKGWYKFPNLPHNIAVATLEKGQLIYRKPTDYIEYDYKGYLLGLKSKRLEFLVTHNHRCYVKKRYSNHYEIKQAEDIFGKDVYFNQEILWTGNDCGFSNSQLELFGFWFGDGYVRNSNRRCDVVFTQSKYPDYIRQLLVKNKETFSEYQKNKRFDFVIYSKQKANFYISNFIGEGKKTIPNWLKQAKPSQIWSFLYGLFMADGSFANGDRTKTDRIRIYGDKQQADDIYELIIKSGRIANMTTRKVNRISYLNGRRIESKADEYDIRILRQGKKVRSGKRRYWYKKKYIGKVYSVTVPSGIVLIRRNGKYHWTGNTDRQIEAIMWAELTGHYEHAGGKNVVGGELYARKLVFDEKNWFCIAFTTKETKGQIGKFQGFHSSNILIIVSEAQAVDDEIFGQIEGIMTSENSRLVLFGNPLRNTGFFARALRETKLSFKAIHLDCRDNPNYVQKREVIPGLASYQWVEDMRKRHGEDSPIWQARVEGKIPDTSIDTVIAYSLATQAKNRYPIYDIIRNIKIVSVDPASFGDDEIVIYLIEDGKITDWDIWLKPSSLVSATGEIIGRALLMKKKHEADGFVVDGIGEGRGVVDGLIDAKENVIEFKGSFAPQSYLKDDYQNLRAEAWFLCRDELVKGYGSIPNDEILIEELTEPKYFVNRRGKYQIEEKEELKERLKRSPNRADAFVQGIWALPQIKARKTGKYNPQPWQLQTA